MPIQDTASITPKSDQRGHTVYVCAPPWFVNSEQLSVARPTAAAKDHKFSGADLNFLARMLYAEASGSAACPDARERHREKTAILHVSYFRIGRAGYPNAAYIATTFTEVAKAPGQFESVFKTNTKLASSAPDKYEHLKAKECADLTECLEAIRDFLQSGPDFKAYPFDKFLAATGRPGWTLIGKTEFSLFASMRDAMKKAQS